MVSRTGDDTLLVQCCVLCVVRVVGVQCVGVGVCVCVCVGVGVGVTTCGRGASTHGDVLNAHTGVFSVPHHTARTHHGHNDIHTRHNNHHHNNTRTQGQRETERDRERQRETRQDET